MANSELHWEPRPEIGQASEPSFRWVRWVIAGLILLTLAFTSHTKGRFASLLMNQTRHWMTSSTHLAGLHIQTPSLLRNLTRAPSPVGGSTRPVGWLAPLAHARVDESFGWHGQAAKAQFNPTVMLSVSRHTPVQLGVRGRVARASDGVVAVKSANHILITIKPLQHLLVKPGQVIQATTVLGQTGSGRLSFEVERLGYPVNPLASSLYGTRWLGHS